MCQSLLADASLWRRLQRLDEQIAAEVRSGGCPRCHGVLHGARYPRKPFGIDRALLGEEYGRRLSFCCAREGCRRRATPPSVRFLGRKAYLGGVVLLVCALTHGVSRQRRALLAAQFGVSERTLERWRRWWRSTLPATPWWPVARSRFAPPLEDAALPASLLARFGEGFDIDSVVAALRFVSPCSVSSFAALPEHAA